MEQDFCDLNSSKDVSLSQEDMTFMDIMSRTIKKLDSGKCEMLLPFKKDRPQLPNNRVLAECRLKHLARKLKTNPKFQHDYSTFMSDIIERGEAVKIQPEDNVDVQWYVPHHGVYHPKKPDKIRVVFDCSAPFKGETLNKHLLTGPDLTNNLFSVLCRFRNLKLP